MKDKPKLFTAQSIFVFFALFIGFIFLSAGMLLMVSSIAGNSNHIINGVIISGIGISIILSSIAIVMVSANITSMGNYFAIGITLPAAGNEAISLVSVNDSFITGAWTNNNATATPRTVIIDDGTVTNTNTTSTALVTVPKVYSGEVTACNNSTVTEIATGDGFIAVIRDVTNGSSALVLYENGQTPTIISQIASASTFVVSGSPGATEIDLQSSGGGSGMTAKGGSSRASFNLQVLILSAN